MRNYCQVSGIGTGAYFGSPGLRWRKVPRRGDLVTPRFLPWIKRQGPIRRPNFALHFVSNLGRTDAICGPTTTKRRRPFSRDWERVGDLFLQDLHFTHSLADQVDSRAQLPHSDLGAINVEDDICVPADDYTFDLSLRGVRMLFAPAMPSRDQVVLVAAGDQTILLFAVRPQEFGAVLLGEVEDPLRVLTVNAENSEGQVTNLGQAVVGDVLFGVGATLGELFHLFVVGLKLFDYGLDSPRNGDEVFRPQYASIDGAVEFLADVQPMEDAVSAVCVAAVAGSDALLQEALTNGALQFFLQHIFHY